MLSSLIRRRWPLPAAAVLLVAMAFGGALAAFSAEDDGTIVIYNGRSHYGTEQIFLDFQSRTGIDVHLRGGTAPELYERLRREGEDTPADLLVTTDLANLWRAEESGLLQNVSSRTLSARVPEGLHDPEGAWWALTTRIRTPVVATERVQPGAVTGYEDLGNPRFEGRTCLRTSQSEYNQSLVADMIAKRGTEATEALLRSWMDNDPEIINSDGEMLGAMSGGECDVGLANHYYLARALRENPDFPVAPAWADQDGAGAHANVSGLGMVRGTDMEAETLELMEFLTTREAQARIAARGEFAANPDVPPAPHIREWDDVKTDPIAVEEAGPLLDEAVLLMAEVGWR